nr:hypothetical protein [Tanacetum cinerariifolium]
IRALIDGKKIIVTEAFIRRDLQLQDAEGTACLPNDAIFEELARMRFVQVFVNHQLGDMSHHKKIFVTPSLTKKVFANMKREEKGFSCIITPLFETMMVQAPEEVGEGLEVPTDTHYTPIVTQPSSSQPQKKQKSRRIQRKETEVPHIEPQTEESIPTPSNDPLPSGEDRMQLTEVIELYTKLSDGVLSLEQIKTNQAAKIKKLKKRVKKLEGKKKKRTLGLKRMYRGRIAKIDADEDLFLTNETAQDHGKLNEEEMFGVDDLNSNKAKDKGKEIMVEPEKPLKKKGQIAFDEEVTRKLDAHMKAEMEKEERIEREKNEANIAVIKEWDDVQATIDADKQLAKQLLAQEREHLSIKEISKLLAKLIESRRKYFAAKRAKEIKNKPPIKAQ